MSQAKGENVSRESLEFAVNYYVKENHLAAEAIKGCIALARVLESAYHTRRAKEGDVELAETFSTPGISLSNEQILAKIDPWVGLVRWQIFRCEDSPFASYKVAVEWLVQTGNEQEATWHRTHARRPRRAERVEIGIDPHWRQQHGAEVGRIIIEAAPNDPVESRLTEGKRSLDGLWHVAVTRRELPYKTADEDCIPESQKNGFEYLRHRLPEVFTKMFPEGQEQIWFMRVYPRTPLATLEQVAHEIAEITGFSKLDAVAYILAGIKPSLAPVVMRFQREPQTSLIEMEYSRTWVVVEVRDPTSITSDQWAGIHRALRERLHVKRLRGSTARDQRLFDLVQKLGGVPPHGGKGPFWERVRQQWNAHAGTEEYKTGRGLAVKYHSMTTKPEALQQTTATPVQSDGE